MARFLYEPHMHTSPASACAVSTGSEMAQSYKDHGYHGIIVTDHFFNGNTGIPDTLPWHERVDAFCQGYFSALETGKRIGLHVFFGWEYNGDNMDFLTYGLPPAWLHDHPDVLEWPIPEYFNRVHADGGFIAQAHPFREAGYIKKTVIYPKYMDGIEVINTCSHQNHNAIAQAYCREYGFIPLSGSDNHCADGSDIRGGLAFPHEVTSMEEFIAALRAGGYALLPDGIPV
nr:histidinol-phosphatase [bacterium]